MITISKGLQKNEYIVTATAKQELLDSVNLNYKFSGVNCTRWDKQGNQINAVALATNTNFLKDPENLPYIFNRLTPKEFTLQASFQFIPNMFEMYSRVQITIVTTSDGSPAINEILNIDIEPNEGISPTNGLDGVLPFLPSFLTSISDDNMTTDEFKKIAADRLETEYVRIKSKIINFDCVDNLTIKFTELSDNRMSTAYVKRANITVDQETETTVTVYDDFNGNNTPVYKSYVGDKQIAFQAYIASRAVITGKCKGQITVYIAERLS